MKETFPEVGNLDQLVKVRSDFILRLDQARQERAGAIFLHPSEVEHVRKTLMLLEGDEEAKATILSIVAFAQMRSDIPHMG